MHLEVTHTPMAKGIEFIFITPPPHRLTFPVAGLQRRRYLTWLSYGRNAMLISFSVLMNFDTGDLHNSLNISSGQAAMEVLRCLLLK